MLDPCVPVWEQCVEVKCKDLRMEAKRKRHTLEKSPDLHLFDKSSQCLQPGHHVHVLLCVHDLDLLPQLRNDGARPPAMFQSQILQNKKNQVLNSNFCACHLWNSTVYVNV